MIATHPIHSAVRLTSIRPERSVKRAGGLRLAGVRGVLADSASMLGVVLSIPLVVLAVGTPVALAVLAVVWAAKWALGVV